MALFWTIEDGKQVAISEDRPYGANGPILIGDQRSDHIESVHIMADMTVIKEQTHTSGTIDTHGTGSSVQVPIGGLSIGANNTQARSQLQAKSITTQTRFTDLTLKLRFLDGSEKIAIVKSDQVYKWLIAESTKTPASDAELERMAMAVKEQAIQAQAWAEATSQTERPKPSSTTLWFGIWTFFASFIFYGISDGPIGYITTFLAWVLLIIFVDATITQPHRRLASAYYEQSKKDRFEEIMRSKTLQMPPPPSPTQT